MSGRGSGERAWQFRQEFDIPAAGSLGPPQSPQSMLGKLRKRKGTSDSGILLKIFSQ